MNRNRSKAGRRTSRKSRATPPPAPRATEEDRRSVVATVGWMLATLATLLGTLLVTVLYLFAPAERSSLLPLMANYLLLACCITGAVALLATPLVYRIRADRPPPLIVAAVVVIGLAPWTILLLSSLP